MAKVAWWIAKGKSNPGGMTGKKHTEETKNKMKLKRQGRKPMLGKKHSEETKNKISLAGKGKNMNEKNIKWKGDKVGYSALHIWIERRLGKPNRCDICGIKDQNKKYEWSSISRKYKRDINDWQRACISCHRKFDYNQINCGGHKVKWK